MTSLTTMLLLPLSLLALYHSTTTTEARAASTNDKQTLALHKRSAPIPNFLEMMRRRKSLEAALRGPPALYQNEYIPRGGVQKREDEWIWMPAHGYIPMPKEDYDSHANEADTSIGNLMRYG